MSFISYLVQEVVPAAPEKIGSSLVDTIRDWLLNLGVPHNIVYFAEFAILIGVIALLSVVSNFVAKKIILSVVKALVRKSKTEWDDILLERKVFHRLSHFAPAMLIYFSSHFILSGFPAWMILIQKGAYLYMIIISLLVIISFINGIHDIYKTYETSKNRSIKGYIQVLKILVYIVGAIIIIATLMGRSPVFMLSGLGAFTAILMLIFQDVLKGLVGGIQLSANDLVRLGDWITVPSHGVDGTVVEINLSTLKIQNADMSFCSIPTYTLVNGSFNNFRGMMNSGGRRIKRSINLDMNSIKCCDLMMLQNFEKINYLSEFIKQKKSVNVGQSEFDSINGKQLTNLAVLKKYVEEYLTHHENLNPEMTWLVRYLDPTPHGLPFEIWVFNKMKDLVSFEKVQSEVFEHIISVVPHFGLKIFQNPSGSDMKNQ